MPDNVGAGTGPGAERPGRSAELSASQHALLVEAAFPAEVRAPRWDSGLSPAVRGSLRLSYLVGGHATSAPQKRSRAECTVELEAHDVVLGAVDLAAFRRTATRILAERGIDSDTTGSGVLVAEIHPAGLTDGGSDVVASPEADDLTLRHVAGYGLFPAEWTATTTSRNYRALVGHGDLVVVAWSGNADYWLDDTRDRVFREFGDARTVDVAWQVLGANTAMSQAYARLSEIGRELARIVGGSTGADAEGLLRIRDIHQQIQDVRRRVGSEVLIPGTGLAVSGTSLLRRLGELHLELASELIPERMTRVLEQGLDGLLHDVEFAMSRRSEESLHRVIERLSGLLQGSREEKRARFVQAVVVLILAGAALFTGILSIPGAIFPDTYPTAALWAALIVSVAGVGGMSLFWAYGRKLEPPRWVAPSVPGLVVLAMAIGGLGLAEAIPPTLAMQVVLGLSFVAAMLGALMHRPDPDLDA